MIEPRGDESDEEADIRLGIRSVGQREEKKLTFEDIPEHIRERVYLDIGQASMCWENPEKAGIFDSQQAAEIGLNLCQFIIEEIEREKKR